MSGVKHKRKGSRIEREMVELFLEIGIHAERVPLSGAARYKGNGADIDVYPFGIDEESWQFEVKGRKNGDGLRLPERWLGANDGLLFKRDRRKPLVVLPWESLEALLVAVRKSCLRGLKKEQRDAIFGRRAARVADGEAGGNDETSVSDDGRRTGVAAGDRAGSEADAASAALSPRSALSDGAAPGSPGRMAARKA